MGSYFNSFKSKLRLLRPSTRSLKTTLAFYFIPISIVPPMAAAVGTADDVKNVANYVLSLSGGPHNAAAAQLGKAKFVVCAACHGPDGKGNQTIGAPNLTDKVWLHGWGEAAIVAMINGGKTNVMPAFGERLSAEQIHVLAAYVWSLSQTASVAAK